MDGLVVPIRFSSSGALVFPVVFAGKGLGLLASKLVGHMLSGGLVHMSARCYEPLVTECF